MDELLAFIDFRDHTKTVLLGGQTYYDVPHHYKYLNESELFTYYFSL